jgi:hypothetical protein
MAETSGKENGDMKEEASAIAKGAEGGPGAMEETEDWDKTRNGASANSDKETSGDDQYKSLGRSNSRGLAQLMSPHAPKGKELIMTEEEEKTLAAELGKWASPTVNSPQPLSDRHGQINTDPNPYETPEDSYFKAQTAE